MTTKKTETASQHTPGPWMVLDDGQQLLRVGAEYAPHGDCICTVEHLDSQADGGRNLCSEAANARLIAAAPDLLAAVALILEFYDGEHGAQGVRRGAG